MIKISSNIPISENKNVPKDPQICIVITGKTLLEINQKVENARELGARLVEIRLDLCNDPINLPLEKLVFPRIKTILTARDPTEGGNRLPKGVRESLIEEALNTPVSFVDIEVANFNEKLIQDRKADQIIISKHWFDRMATPSELKHILKHYSKYGLLKLIPTAMTVQDNFSILEFVSTNKQAGTPIIGFCMGNQGRISRILSLIAGSPFTYASLDKPIAPGQFQITQLRRLYHDLTS